MSTENQRVAEWLHLLGCSVELSEESLSLLNTPRMRSIWRHLQKHVMSRQKVHLIRKNLLLAKLNQINAPPSKFGYKIESVKDLSEMQNFESLKIKTDNIETEIKRIDDKLEQESINLFTRKAQLECMKSETMECETKTTLLELKLSQMQKDTDYISKETSKIKLLALQKTKLCERKLVIQTLFPNYVLSNYKSLLFDGKCDIAERTIVMGHGLPANVIYDGICYDSRRALMSLKQLQIQLNMSVFIDSLTKKQKANGVLSFSKQLDHLRSKVVENEFSLQRFDKNIKRETNELEKVKTLLINLLNEIFADNSKIENCHKEVVDTIEKYAMSIKKEEIVQAFVNQLNTDSSNFESLNFEVEKLHEQVNDSKQKVEECVNEINKLVNEIGNNNVSIVKTEALKKCTDNARSVLARLKQGNYSEQYSLAESQIVEEVDVFQKAPMAAIRREWTNNGNDVIKDPQLILLLLHSEQKNIMQIILEKVLLLCMLI